MIQKITALSNAPVTSVRTDALAFAFRDVLETLGALPEASVDWLTAESPNGSDGNALLTSSENFTQNLLGACRRLMARYEMTAERVADFAKNADAFLLGDIRGLSTAEWVPSLSRTPNAVPWVFSDWPREFPLCDPFWREHRHGAFARRLVASTCVKLAYKNNPAHRDRLACVTTAIFASEALEKRNRASFPHLENAFTLPLPLDTEIFKFKPQTRVRAKIWGWIGDLENDAEDVAIVLKIFAFEALQNPDCRFYLATNIDSANGQKIVAEIRNHPALAPRVSFLKPPTTKEALAAMLRDFGVLVEPRRRRKGEYPQLIVDALACGCFPLCGKDEETEALLGVNPEMLFPAETPSSAFLRCEKLKVYSPEARTEILEKSAANLAKTRSREAVARRLFEIL